MAPPGAGAAKPEEGASKALAQEMLAQADMLVAQECDEEYARDLANADIGITPDSVGKLVVEVHCVADLGIKNPSYLTNPAVYVVVAVSSDGVLTAEQHTESSVVDVQSKRVSWDSRGGWATFQLPAGALASASVCFTLYAFKGYDCCDPDDYTFLGGATGGGPKALASSGPLAIASRGGQAVDWADGTPRDHFLDTGAVLTASTTFIGSEPRDAAETATA